MDGFDFVRKLKLMPEYSHVPIIAVTEYDEQECRKILKTEVSAFFTKPYTHENIRLMVYNILYPDS